MHLKSKKIALCGVLLAFAMIMVLIGSALQFSSLSLAALGAFCTGIAYREFELKYSVAFLISGIIISLIIAPDKYIAVVYIIMSVYIFAREALWDTFSAKISWFHQRKGKLFFWAIRFLVFLIMYIPCILLFPAMFEIQTGGWLTAAYIAVCIVIVPVIDLAYGVFYTQIWTKVHFALKLDCQ